MTQGSATSGSTSLLQIILLHHVYPEEETAFVRLLDWFRSEYRVIPFKEGVERVVSGQLDQRYGAITFDDGLKSNLRAAEIMSARGLSGCFFVCPGIVGSEESSKRAAFSRRARMVYQSDAFVSWDDLESMVGQGHEIGNHTMNHLQLSNLPASEVADEVGVAHEVLSKRLGPVVHFSWPFGTFECLGNPPWSLWESLGYRSYSSGHRGTHGAHEQMSLMNPCLRRDNLEARWPLRHIQYLLRCGSTSPVQPEQWWPR
jgi:peptidoglycan/xylan/chitin deacetylase (PgdA/CDA1 family)